MAKGNPRRSNGARRTALRRKVKAMGLPCALCGKPIDYTLPPGHPMSYELDEIVPVSRGGEPARPGERAARAQDMQPKEGGRAREACGLLPSAAPLAQMVGGETPPVAAQASPGA